MSKEKIISRAKPIKSFSGFSENSLYPYSNLPWKGMEFSVGCYLDCNILVINDYGNLVKINRELFTFIESEGIDV